MTTKAKTQKVSFYAIIEGRKFSLGKDGEQLQILFDKTTKLQPKHLGSSQRVVKVNLEVPESMFDGLVSEATVYVPELPKAKVTGDAEGGSW